ncbi:PREDICTED: ribosomal large subunit pseudouridine synthase C-like [Trachymyrmex cornetzi]|uniref:ribosomal large subunit pseudouridine synthase C-like n=1 Tax=Trachymyrmex cornetzi TaxID=471704 RepID=UPI00084F7493|nr:PREDICTED: ribosomal large subunit pseudouridine synthase C-like [Trachymyrmex cornetzi]
MNIHKILVSQQDAGSRLSKLVSKYFAAVSFAAVAKLVRTGQIRVNGKRSALNMRLEKDDEVRIPMHESTAMHSIDHADRKFSELEKKIVAELVKSLIYKDENILVLNKPAGLAVQGGSNIKISIDSISRLLQFDADEKPRLVHRLDKETSEILLLARSKLAAQTLSLALKEQIIQKKYIVILDGVPEITEDVIDIPINKSAFKCGQFEKVHENSKGKNAVTQYKGMYMNTLFQAPKSSTISLP